MLNTIFQVMKQLFLSRFQIKIQLQIAVMRLTIFGSEKYFILYHPQKLYFSAFDQHFLDLTQ